MAARKENRLEKSEKGDQGEAIMRFHDMMMVSELKKLSLGWTGEDGMFFFFNFLLLILFFLHIILIYLSTYLLVMLHGMAYGILVPQTRDQTHTPCTGNTVINTGPPGKSQKKMDS